MRTILQCKTCGKYTMKEPCLCSGNAITPRPAKFNPEDKYATYRRQAKKRQEEEMA